MTTKAIAGLAFGLALLSCSRVGVWASDRTLWADAAIHAPLSPRPWVNLAALALRDGQHEQAAVLLDEAAALAQRQADADRRWTLDVVAANRGVLFVQEGAIDQALAVTVGAPKYSARWMLCYRLGVCRES